MIDELIKTIKYAMDFPKTNIILNLISIYLIISL